MAQSQALLGHTLPTETPSTAAAVLLASSAARALAVLANDELLDALRAGQLSPTEALAEARELGASLFEGGTDPADPTLTAAMLGALAPPVAIDDTAETDDSPDDDSPHNDSP